MAFARVVSFEGVDAAQITRVADEVGSSPRPDDIPATEILLLHDPEGNGALVVQLFDTEDDYRRGEAALDAMDPADTPGRRTAVQRYTVAGRVTA